MAQGSILSGADYRKAAAIFEAASPLAPKPELMQICSRWLYEFADFGCRNIENQTIITQHFLDEIAAEVANICKEPGCSPELLDDAAFILVECFAVISKELVWGKNTQLQFPAQAEVMRFFEESGHWRPDDGTLVSEYYHVRIPH